ncbi:OPT oligopeptide transporter protein-domain-containing protein [Chytriomyces cf. hyalinus JEL632]|nr:OPT oligopeptide transporter protein-domain-containing protein [Chytriomyces cf. hyalinus JEL632]
MAEAEAEAGDAVSSSIAYLVPKSDDPDTPAFTFRAILIGSLFALGLTVAMSVWAFRTNASMATSATFAVVASYPMGVLAHRLLPPHPFWNPGPFSVKEHVLIFIITHSCSVPYGMENVVSQAMPTLMGNTNITFLAALSFVIVTQFTGFGFAGLCRRFLVKPPSMIWPSNVSIMAIFISFHNTPTSNSEESREYSVSKKLAFWYSFLGMFVYTHIPELLLPGLQTISVCSQASFAGLQAGMMGTYNAIASTTNGVGLFGLTLDWYYVQSSSPVTTPFWALLCSRVGNVIVAWVAVVLLFTNDHWGLSQLMSLDNLNPTLNSLHLYAGNANSTTHRLGSKVDPTFFYDKTRNYNLNATAYDDVQPLHITSYFAVQYGASFLTISSVLSHVFLWYGSAVWRQLKSAIKQVADATDAHDVHNRIMSAYWDPPDWMFLVFAAGMIGLTFIVSLFTPFEIPWWGVLLNVALTSLLIVPVGIIAGISGITIGISVLAEFLMGSIIPGHTVAVMAFKSLALNNLNQGLTLVMGLKLGHYLHVPPVAVISAQFLGTFINAVVATGVTWWMMFYSGDLLDAHHGSWQYIAYQSFYSDGAIWGAIGPVRFFGVGSIYEGLLWCFLVGFLCPFGPWLCNRYIYKSSYWQFVNFLYVVADDHPTFFSVGGYQNNVVVPLFISFLFQVILFRYFKNWYHNFAFVMASGFDVGTGIAILSTAVLGMAKVRLPWNALNPNLENVPTDFYCYNGATYLDFPCGYYSATNQSDPRAC